MNTRYSSLVNLKKNIMQKSERVLQQMNANLLNAMNVLSISFETLNEINTPTTGRISVFLANRTLLDRQRELIQYNERKVLDIQEELHQAQEQLKIDTIEFEKFSYLEYQEIQIILKKQKLQESKDLDEIAIMTYGKKNKSKDTL